MSDVLSTLLRFASGDLLSVWAGRSGLVWSVPPTPREQARWAALVIPELALTNPQALAQLRNDADGISELCEPSKDWIFRDLLRHHPEIPPTEIESRNSFSRSLWLWLNANEAYRWCSRRAQTFDPYGKPRLFNRFRCQSVEDFFVDDSKLAPFITELQSLYRAHDFSGEDILPTLDWDFDENGRRTALTLHAEVARLPSFEAHISAEGERDDQLLRKPTVWRCRFEFCSGQLDLYCDRGGPKLRTNSAEAFVRLVLGQQEAPVLINAPALELELLADLSGLTSLPGQTGWTVHELCLQDPISLDFFSIRSDADAWSAAQRLTGAPLGDPGGFIVQSAIVKAFFEDGSGASKRAEKMVQLEVFGDGRVRAGKDGKRIREVKTILEAHLSQNRG